MKWSLFDLSDKTQINETVNYKDKAKETLDILDIEETFVTGTLVKEMETKLKADLHVKTILHLACARSLKEVIYPLEFDLELVFSSDEDSDYPINDPLDLYDIVFGNIVAEKPYSVFHESTTEDDFKEEKATNPAFSDLDKLLKK